MVSHIRQDFASKNKRLKQYRNVVWDEIEEFDAFGITSMDRKNNKMVDLLANVAIKPDDISFVGVSKSGVQNRPSIPNNIEKWQVFEHDRDILNFLLNEDRYHGKELDCDAFFESMHGRDIIF